MDLLKDKTGKIYYRYLMAAFGNAMASSIYSIVDMAAVGQYEGAAGTAVLAIVAPIWNIIYSPGMLMGFGGSVLFSARRGQMNSNEVENTGIYRKSNEIFTAALIGALILAFGSWLIILFLEKPLLVFCGADETLLPLAVRYLEPIRYVMPSFLLVQMLAAFLRNDGNPALAAFGVLAGGIFNVFGDIYFIFGRLWISDFAGGYACHFITRKNTLKLYECAICSVFLAGFPLPAFRPFSRMWA